MAYKDPAFILGIMSLEVSDLEQRIKGLEHRNSRLTEALEFLLTQVDPSIGDIAKGILDPKYLIEPAKIAAQG